MEFLTIYLKKQISKDEYEAKLKENNYVQYKESDVAKSLEARYKKNYEEAKRENIESEEERENYAILSWSEGIFHYGFDDIDCVVIDPKNTNSLKKGYAFSKVIEEVVGHKIEFVYAKESGKGVEKIDRKKLKDFIYKKQSDIDEVNYIKEKYRKRLEEPTKKPHKPKAHKTQKHHGGRDNL